MGEVLKRASEALLDWAEHLGLDAEDHRKYGDKDAAAWSKGKARDVELVVKDLERFKLTVEGLALAAQALLRGSCLTPGRTLSEREAVAVALVLYGRQAGQEVDPRAVGRERLARLGSRGAERQRRPQQQRGRERR